MNEIKSTLYQCLAFFCIPVFCIAIYAAAGIAGIVTLDTAAILPDTFEKDDTFDNATVYAPSTDNITQSMSDYGMLPQRHNFHIRNDEDWIKFYALSDGWSKGWYTIKVNNTEKRCDPVIELYDRDGRTLLVTRDSYTDGESEYLDWKCPLDGVYYVRILQANTEIFGQDTGYDLAIYLPVMSAGTGIIAGSIVNSISGSLIDGALIKTDVGGAALSQDGYYVMLHPSGIPSLTCNALNYLPATASLSLNAGDTSIKDISLIPLGALSTTTTTTATGNTCMIEAIYGNQAEETVVLKHFRDTVLTNARCGRKIIKAYYEWGPGLLVLMQKHHQVRHLLKHVVDDMIVFIKASSPFF